MSDTEETMQAIMGRRRIVKTKQFKEDSMGRWIDHNPQGYGSTNVDFENWQRNNQVKVLSTSVNQKKIMPYIPAPPPPPQPTYERIMDVSYEVYEDETNRY